MTGIHRDLGPRQQGFTDKGVDLAVRRKVFLWIVVLGLTAALIWTALIMRGDAISGTPVIGAEALTVTYNEQGWPIITNVMGVALHPEDLGRVRGDVDVQPGCS